MTEGVKFTIDALDKTGRAFNDVKGKLNGLDQSVGKLKNAFGGLGGVIAGAFAVGYFKNIGDAASRINDLSVKLKVNAEILSSYQLLAGQTGVGLEDVGKAMQMLGKNSVEAAQGSKEALGALSALGIDALKFKELGLDQQFVALAEALQGVTNPAERINIAMALMGKSGADMLQAMDEGGQAIQTFQQEADRLYITLSQDQVGAIDSAFDAWGKLGQSITGIAQHILAFVAPAIEGLAAVLTEVLVGAVNIVVDAFSGMKRAFDEVIAWIMRRFGDLVGVIASAKEVLGNLPGEIGKSYAENAAQLRQTADLLKNIRVEADKTAKASRSAADILAGVQGDNPGKVKLVGGVKGKKPKADKDDLGNLPWLMNETGQKSKQVSKEIADDWRNVATNVGGDWIDALTGIGGGFDDLKTTALRSLEQIGSSMLKNLLNQAIGGGGGGSSLPWLNQGGGGGGFLSGITSGLGDFFGGFFAEGGNPPVGKPYVVGENGPELRIDRTPSTIIPNHALGGNQPIIINISTPDVNGFRKSQSQVAAAMAEAVRRGQRNL
jgi:hypothetical protein